jgi:IS30 family transposase
MNDYTHLSMKERCLLTTYLSMKVSISIIAKKMCRHRSTLYLELSRNTSHGHYLPGLADARAKERHPKSANKLEEHEELNLFVLEGLKKGWSPEQISGRMKMEQNIFYACPESIYRYIYRNKMLGLYKYLFSRKSKRRARFTRNFRQKRLQIIERNICHRAEEVNKRNQIGHWAGDTIRFQHSQKTCVTTLVERKSRYVCLRKNEDKKSKTVIGHIYQAINSVPKKMWSSLTFDQGIEFMDFRTIERQTKCKIFFCDPHSPWQRGSNENMNGRLRRYLPKNFNIDIIDQDYLNKIAHLANHTPRKCLSYCTPNEVVLQHWKGFCRTTL